MIIPRGKMEEVALHCEAMHQIVANLKYHLSEAEILLHEKQSDRHFVRIDRFGLLAFAGYDTNLQT